MTNALTANRSIPQIGMPRVMNPRRIHPTRQPAPSYQAKYTANQKDKQREGYRAEITKNATMTEKSFDSTASTEPKRPRMRKLPPRRKATDTMKLIHDWKPRPEIRSISGRSREQPWPSNAGRTRARSGRSLAEPESTVNSTASTSYPTKAARELGGWLVQRIDDLDDVSRECLKNGCLKEKSGTMAADSRLPKLQRIGGWEVNQRINLHLFVYHFLAQ